MMPLDLRVWEGGRLVTIRKSGHSAGALSTSEWSRTVNADVFVAPVSGACAGPQESSGAYDRCPGAMRLHKAADGWLARIRIPGGRLTAAQLPVIADLAERHGNGAVELTSRANVQVRGLAASASDAIARALVPAGLLPAPSHERVRNVLASPLAGRDPLAVIDGERLTVALDGAICAAPRLTALSGRFQFAVEDGAGHVDLATSDVALVARGHGRVGLCIGGRRTGLEAAAGDAPALAIAAAEAFVDVAAGTSGRTWRIADVGAERVIERLPGALPGPFIATAAAAPPPLGAVGQRGGGQAVTALVPLGRLRPAQLRGLATLGSECRVSPWSTVTVLDACRGSAEQLEALGLVLDPDSGWQGLTACVGSDGCARAGFDVRAMAARRVAERGPGDPREHWSACPRQCGRRPGAIAMPAQVRT